MAQRRRTIKDDLEELRAMRNRSAERQGRDPVKEMGSSAGEKAMKMPNSSQNFQSGGYSTKTKVDGSKMTNKTSSGIDSYREAQKEQVKPKAPAPRNESKPRQRPGAGREDMMSRYMDERKRKQSGQSRVIG
jgi:hypothetical protein